jgi:FemAB-related protein (PEP-CTERM system-associated)
VKPLFEIAVFATISEYSYMSELWMNNIENDAPIIFPATSPADDPAWGRAICRAHGLHHVNLSAGILRAELFSARGRRPAFFSAPYLSDGGVYNSKNLIDGKSLAKLHCFLEETNARFILLKSRVPLSNSEDNCVVDRSYFTFTLDIRGGSEYIWNNVIRAKIRNQVRSGFKWKPSIRTGRVELINDFYRVFSECMRDLGTPVYGKKFFEAILEEFGDRCEILIMEVPGLGVVSGGILITCGDTMFHPYAVTLKSALPKSLNNSFYWKLIEHACRKNLKCFDMGRSHQDQGTFQYKKNWEAQPVQLYYNYFLARGEIIPSRETNQIKLATNMWKKMPLMITNALGPNLIKRMM